jgi:hypothetical protein
MKWSLDAKPAKAAEEDFASLVAASKASKIELSKDVAEAICNDGKTDFADRRSPNGWTYEDSWNYTAHDYFESEARKGGSSP